MNIDNTIEIASSAENVWNILYRDFDKAYTWMSFVKHSYGIEENENEGRVCHFTDKGEEGTFARELITQVDEKNKTFSIEVGPQNASGLLPVEANVVTIRVEKLDANNCRVHWNSAPRLKPIGKWLSPLLRFGFSKGFGAVLKELKTFAEKKQEA